jgi:hypothetical protein
MSLKFPASVSLEWPGWSSHSDSWLRGGTKKVRLKLVVNGVSPCLGGWVIDGMTLTHFYLVVKASE